MRRLSLGDAIQRGRTKNRENEVPIEKNTLFNTRSMTKPITGVAAQTLIDRDKLHLDDRVGDYLPSFDNERSDNITVEQLLTHQAGLPLTILPVRMSMMTCGRWQTKLARSIRNFHPVVNCGTVTPVPMPLAD